MSVFESEQSSLGDLELVVAEDTAVAQPQVIQSQESASEKLLKLGQLRDAGVLTVEEFEAKKAALIEQL